MNLTGTNIKLPIVNFNFSQAELLITLEVLRELRAKLACMAGIDTSDRPATQGVYLCKLIYFTTYTPEPDVLPSDEFTDLLSRITWSINKALINSTRTLTHFSNMFINSYGLDAYLLIESNFGGIHNILHESSWNENCDGHVAYLYEHGGLSKALLQMFNLIGYEVDDKYNGEIHINELANYITTIRAKIRYEWVDQMVEQLEAQVTNKDELNYVI